MEKKLCGLTSYEVCCISIWFDSEILLLIFCGCVLMLVNLPSLFTTPAISVGSIQRPSSHSSSSQCPFTTAKTLVNHTQWSIFTVRQQVEQHHCDISNINAWIYIQLFNSCIVYVVHLWVMSTKNKKLFRGNVVCGFDAQSGAPVLLWLRCCFSSHSLWEM